ncbi:hypothetical protein, partial [Pseudomonas sp. LA5]|uniref:hypothetical protein n=1 Tax=Pseudomonas sp. LA5 TaxID=3027850 RepID=UPI00236079B2
GTFLSGWIATLLFGRNRGGARAKGGQVVPVKLFFQGSIFLGMQKAPHGAFCSSLRCAASIVYGQTDA